MKAWRGRPIITTEDYPETIYAALDSSVAYYHKELGSLAAGWTKTAQDSEGTIQDAFGHAVIDSGIEELRPDGEARLYMSLEQLELALVNYGCERIEESGVDTTVEVENVDRLLRSIDDLK